MARSGGGARGIGPIPAILGGYYLGPTFALTQAMSTLRMRAMAASVILFFINLIGMGLGPQVTGLASDLLAANTGLGGESLRWALVCVLMVNVVASVCYFLASRDLRADLARTAG